MVRSWVRNRQLSFRLCSRNRRSPMVRCFVEARDGPLPPVEWAAAMCVGTGRSIAAIPGRGFTLAAGERILLTFPAGGLGFAASSASARCRRVVLALTGKLQARLWLRHG